MKLNDFEEYRCKRCSHSEYAVERHGERMPPSTNPDSDGVIVCLKCSEVETLAAWAGRTLG